MVSVALSQVTSSDPCMNRSMGRKPRDDQDENAAAQVNLEIGRAGSSKWKTALVYAANHCSAGKKEA